MSTAREDYVTRLDAMMKVLRRLRHEATAEDAAYHNRGDVHKRALQHVARAAFAASALRGGAVDELNRRAQQQWGCEAWASQEEYDARRAELAKA